MQTKRAQTLVAFLLKLFLSEQENGEQLDVQKQDGSHSILSVYTRSLLPFLLRTCTIT